MTKPSGCLMKMGLSRVALRNAVLISKWITSRTQYYLAERGFYSLLMWHRGEYFIVVYTESLFCADSYYLSFVAFWNSVVSRFHFAYPFAVDWGAAWRVEYELPDLL
jgi:hypothetical protein